jgi:hypothetical protein
MASNYDSFHVNYRTIEGLILAASFNQIIVPSATGVDIANDKILYTLHPFIDGDMLLYTAGTAAITGLTDGQYVFVVSKTTNDFKVSATLGGSAINLTGTGTGDQTFTQAALVKIRAVGASSDAAESPLKTDIVGLIASGSLAAVAVGTTVNFRVEEFRGMAFSVAQITT